VIKLFTKNKIGDDGSSYDDHRLPHDTGPHHTLSGKAPYQKEYDAQIGQKTHTQMVLVPVFTEPLEVSIPEQL
jgi:hypothetical protein